MLLNNDEAKGFYEMCYLANEMEGLVGSNPGCRESFIVDASKDDYEAESEFGEVKEGLVRPIMSKNVEKDFYTAVQKVLTDEPDLLEWLNTTEPSISEFLLKLSDKLGGQERVENFIKYNVEPRMQTSFAGRANEVSARFILSRLVEAITTEKVDLSMPALSNDDQMSNAIDECFQKIKRTQKGFFVMHKLGFSHVFAKLAISLAATGRFKAEYSSPVTGLKFEDKVSVVTTAGQMSDFDKVISTIDGLNLRKIVDNSELPDKD